ncbi:hypothetical protein [Pseudobacillus badius]|uniref:hypothetical protein n=1 Tax=Bacillus badius TaxID=1455 RepID=UPI0007B35FEB|nr:hypothetical protein [Bacillus badius]KZR60599.1 hypothetical protein A3781_06855 [Bacillus badius]MED0668492.1 hypothetical protein [Bacillus badius]
MLNISNKVWGICSTLALSSLLITNTVSAEGLHLDQYGNKINSIIDRATGEEISFEEYQQMLKDSEGQEISVNTNQRSTNAYLEIDDTVVITDDNINDTTPIPPYNSTGDIPPILLPNETYPDVGSHTKLFARESKSSYLGAQKRASKPLANCSRTKSEKRVGASRTEGWSANISLTSDELSTIVPNLGFTFNKSATFSESVALGVLPGEIGWVEFAPKKNKAVGKLNYYVDGIKYKTKSVTITSPAKMNNALDGVDVTKSRDMTATEKGKYCKR